MIDICFADINLWLFFGRRIWFTKAKREQLTTKTVTKNSPILLYKFFSCQERSRSASKMQWCKWHKAMSRFLNWWKHFYKHVHKTSQRVKHKLAFRFRLRHYVSEPNLKHAEENHSAQKWRVDFFQTHQRSGSMHREHF